MGCLDNWVLAWLHRTPHLLAELPVQLIATQRIRPSKSQHKIG
jgi:hypothetical protein